jgi:hypothetical protein
MSRVRLVGGINRPGSDGASRIPRAIQEADADGMRVALATHDAVLRKSVKQHGGFLFKHTGDGVCARSHHRGLRQLMVAVD